MPSSAQIIPFYSHPHVHTVINDNSYYDETAVNNDARRQLPYSTVIVTGADMGIDNKFIRLQTLVAKKKIFGDGNYKKYGQPSIQADVLLNGNTNVWFCRVLPDNATYANAVVVAYYRKGKILDELQQETGLHRLEVKFGVKYANKPKLEDGALHESDIEDFANTLRRDTADPVTGYSAIPLFFVRSSGRGQYGNRYGMHISRNSDSENEYGAKLYNFNLISTELGGSNIINIFAGSLTENTTTPTSLLISDVIGVYEEGLAPISIIPFTDNYTDLFEFYQSIVTENAKYLASGSMSKKEAADLKYAQAITEEQFDPLFGYKLNTRSAETIPYYHNYTTKSGTAYVAPALTIPNTIGAIKPLNISTWNGAYVGAKVLMVSDPLHSGHRWLYTVTAIDKNTGDIIYDDGEESQIDADQYDGVNLSNTAGFMFTGGHDGDFQEITVNGVTRRPTTAEMKILLSREYVKAFRGKKDNKILSPSRIDLDFIIDANYNMTNDSKLRLDTSITSLYYGSSVLTDKDNQQLTVLGSGAVSMDFSDIDVKRAMYDLNSFRNRNGVSAAGLGAGCSLYLDANFVGGNSATLSSDLNAFVNSVSDMVTRDTSIDIGHYSIIDPNSNRRIKVTVAYYIAANLVNHITKFGINKPFVNAHARLVAVSPTSRSARAANAMIADTFQPSLDLIDWDVKEMIYKNRINYYIMTEEGRYVDRATQSTRQIKASYLLEENNVRVLNVLKKGLERANRSYLYDYSDANVRKGYTDAQMKIYEPWIGTMVEALEIYFDANEFEQTHMMMHCYAAVKFRDISKRIILEIDIMQPTAEGGNR